LKLGDRLVLADCGEGIQVPMRELGWGFRDLDAIVITHFHGDHVAGLPGLLLTAGNAERREPMHLYGPTGLRRVVRGLRTIAPCLPYPVRVHQVEGGSRIEVAGMSIRTLTLDHGTPCLGYRFDVARAPGFQAERARELGVPVQRWKRLQQGHPVRVGDRVISPDEVLGPPRRGLAVAFITDTNPIDAIAEFAVDVDLLVCESTYGDEADRPKARERGHMLMTEAADLARRAGAHRLWLTHFSAAMPKPEIYLPAARAIFPNTELGHERKTLSLAFPAD
jgi:ribonuclease Z